MNRWHNYRMEDYQQDEFTLQTHFSSLTVYYKLEGDWTPANNSSLKKNTLWFFLMLISATHWYINNTDWPDIKKEDRHWTSYVSKATGLLEATPVFHPWSANARFASSCLQKQLDNKWPPLLSQKWGHNPHHHSHTRMWHLRTIYGLRLEHRSKALRSLDFHFLFYTFLYSHIQSNSPATSLFINNFHLIILLISSTSKKAITHICNEEIGLAICQRELMTRNTIQVSVAALFSIHFIGKLQNASPNSFNLFEYYTGLKPKSKLPTSVSITTCKKH